MWKSAVMFWLLLVAIYGAYVLVDQAITLTAPAKTDLSKTELNLSSQSPKEQKSATENELFNNLSQIKFQDYQGRERTLADFKGRPLILNSWASWCPFCIEELPAFSQVQAEFGDKVVIVAINRKEPLSIAKNFSDRVGVYSENLQLWLDPKDSFYRTIGGFSMPETLFIDEQGKVTEHKRGPMEYQVIREKAKKLLES